MKEKAKLDDAEQTFSARALENWENEGGYVVPASDITSLIRLPLHQVVPRINIDIRETGVHRSVDNEDRVPLHGDSNATSYFHCGSI